MRTSISLCLLLLCAGCDSGGSDSEPSTSSGGSTSSGDSTGPDDGGTEDTTGSGAGADESSSGGAATPSGPELYASLCAGCHGLEAEGTSLGYELRHPDRGLYTHVIRNGRPGLEFPDSAMAAYGEELISDEQLEELFDWLDDFDQPTTGEQLYADYCANCHGAEPDAGVIDAEIVGRSLDDLIEKIREGEGGGNYEPRGGYMTAFSADVLDDAEIEAIAEAL